MNTIELEERWRSITHKGVKPYRSLLISVDCIPELYLALDIKGDRFLILQVPKDTPVQCNNIKMENLRLEWHEETHFILMGLLNNRFTDLYNDLTLSLYNRIKNISQPETYTSEFINSFYKWAEFFDDTLSNLLTENDAKGLFGELTMLLWYLNNPSNTDIDEILKAWQGPYGKAQDFIFSSYNLEVKTKNVDEISIRISSEYQLQPELGKELKLSVIDVLRNKDGISLRDLVYNIRSIILAKGGDLSIFIKAITKGGLGGSNAELYNNLKWTVTSLNIYNCNDEDFPKIISSQLQTGISNVKYTLNVSILGDFIIQTLYYGT